VLRDATLILTQPHDVTADVIFNKMTDDGLPVVRFDTGTFPQRARLTVRWQDGVSRAVLDTGDGLVDLDTLRSVWYRRPAEFSFSAGMEDDTVPFARAEARQGLSGALLTSGARWMNWPPAESVAGFKLVQLQYATRLGLLTPETLVTNEPDEAREFLDAENSGQETIYKRLSNQLLYTEDGRLTSFQTEKIDAEARKRLEHVAVTPCLFQRYVPKAYEIRATVVGAQVFAASVQSQDSDAGAVDWRMDTQLSWHGYELPATVERQLRDLVAGLGLLFGAIDLIRRPDGEYVFLEVNPSGQWAWFDPEITNAIRDAMIGELTCARDCADHAVQLAGGT
jgi:glutathione synthase/RimK-type ligase-like ATP-grasp enzyme